MGFSGLVPTREERRTDAVAADARRLRAALLKAVEVIQTWHNMDAGKDASALWDIYWRNAPEMKPIREALAPLKEGKP